MNAPRARGRVKICGITRRDDALQAVEAGADALGFNLFAGSKRHLELAAHVGWIAELAGRVERVAVMVNPGWDEVQNVIRSGVIDAIQFHGSESAEFCARIAQLGFPFIKALRLSGREVLADPAQYQTSAFLLDAFVPGSFGGTGTLVDLVLAREFVAAHPEVDILISGGLNPANVRAAIRAVAPAGVDVASGVESSPGRKDAAAVGAFIGEARAEFGGAPAR